MKTAIAILFLSIAMLSVSCKASKQVTENDRETSVTTEITKNNFGEFTEGLALNIDGSLYHADTYTINQMGTFWIVKGTMPDSAVFSIMLPEIKGAQKYTVQQGGEVSVTYATSKAKGFLFFAPFAENNGWVKTELLEGYLKGSFEVAVNNGAVQKMCTGMFSIKMP